MEIELSDEGYHGKVDSRGACPVRGAREKDLIGEGHVQNSRGERNQSKEPVYGETETPYEGVQADIKGDNGGRYAKG